MITITLRIEKRLSGVSTSADVRPYKELPEEEARLAEIMAAIATKKGAANASQIGETEAVHGNLQPQSVQSEGEVPSEISGRGILPQASESEQPVLQQPGENEKIKAPETVAPAVPMGGPIKRGPGRPPKNMAATP